MLLSVPLPEHGGKTWGLRFTHRAFATLARAGVTASAAINAPSGSDIEIEEAVFLAGLVAWTRWERAGDPPPTAEQALDLMDQVPLLVLRHSLKEALRLGVEDPDNPFTSSKEAATGEEGKPPTTR